MALPRHRKALLALLLAVVVLNVLGAPGLGIETRDDSDFPAWIFPLFLVVGFGPLAAVATLWKRPRIAAGVAIGVSLAAILLNLADFAGLIIEEEPPAGLRVLELAIVAVSAAILLVSRRVWAGAAPGHA